MAQEKNPKVEEIALQPYKKIRDMTVEERKALYAVDVILTLEGRSVEKKPTGIKYAKATVEYGPNCQVSILPRQFDLDKHNLICLARNLDADAPTKRFKAVASFVRGTSQKPGEDARPYYFMEVLVATYKGRNITLNAFLTEDAVEYAKARKFTGFTLTERAGTVVVSEDETQEDLLFGE